MSTKKKLKDYISKGVRKLKHRKGYGVHSPFAYAVITEVIEEKCPYYAYQKLSKLYPKDSPVKFKVATLLFRLANRFRARRILEIGCDAGYSQMPLLMVDSRNVIHSVAGADQKRRCLQHLSLFAGFTERVTFIDSIEALPEDYVADMIVVNGAPASMSPADFAAWLQLHLSERGIFFVRGIQPGRQMESYWDEICECDHIEVTMDLYDYGLAIRQPRFFKQHYQVAF